MPLQHSLARHTNVPPIPPPDLEYTDAQQADLESAAAQQAAEHQPPDEEEE